MPKHSGALKPGQTVIEATSGNTGIGLAMVCAQKGYPLVVTMAENFIVERRKMMRFLGAQGGPDAGLREGHRACSARPKNSRATHGWFLCRQFENEANADVHSRTTAVEILEDFEGERLDYWVTGFGTGGTLKGVSRGCSRSERPEHQDRRLRTRQLHRCWVRASRRIATPTAPRRRATRRSGRT